MLFEARKSVNILWISVYDFNFMPSLLVPTHPQRLYVKPYLQRKCWGYTFFWGEKKPTIIPAKYLWFWIYRHSRNFAVGSPVVAMNCHAQGLVALLFFVRFPPTQSAIFKSHASPESAYIKEREREEGGFFSWIGYMIRERWSIIRKPISPSWKKK